MAAPDRWYTASIRVFGDSIPFDELNALAPDRETFSGRKGEHYQNNSKLGTVTGFHDSILVRLATCLS